MDGLADLIDVEKGKFWLNFKVKRRQMPSRCI